MKTNNQNRGIIQLILLIIIFLLIISYFGINLKSVINSPAGQSNFGFAGEIVSKIWHFLVMVWNNYLITPATLIWNKVFVGLIWNSLVQILNQLPG